MGGEYVQTVVVGGGQAGLALGYHLARRGLPFVILDAGQHFLFAMSSATLIGIGRDAEHVARAVERRVRATRRSRAAEAGVAAASGAAVA